jgi:hypothetical protein
VCFGGLIRSLGVAKETKGPNTTQIGPNGRAGDVFCVKKSLRFILFPTHIKKHFDTGVKYANRVLGRYTDQKINKKFIFGIYFYSGLF